MVFWACGNHVRRVGGITMHYLKNRYGDKDEYCLLVDRESAKLLIVGVLAVAGLMVVYFIM